jgi:hypothetical protein
MTTSAVEAAIDELEAGLVRPRAPGSFAEGELEGVPDPVRRYLRASIPLGTPLAQSARLRMRGSIKLGRLWIPFRARQTLAPLHGFVWAARAGGIMAGSDRYVDGRGVMDWKLFGLVPADTHRGPRRLPELSRSGRGRSRMGAHGVAPAVRGDLERDRPTPHHGELRNGRDRARTPLHPRRRSPRAVHCTRPMVGRG